MLLDAAIYAMPPAAAMPLLIYCRLYAAFTPLIDYLSCRHAISDYLRLLRVADCLFDYAFHEMPYAMRHADADIDIERASTCRRFRHDYAAPARRR